MKNETTPIRILMIDDEKPVYFLIKALLTEISDKEYEIDWSSTFDEGLELMTKNSYDVYLVDFLLIDGRTGLELIQEANQNGCTKPIILLTGIGDRDIDLQAMEAGATDYISKNDFDSKYLERSIRYSIMQKENENKLKNYQIELETIVAERTKKLELINSRLISEIKQKKKIETDLVLKNKQLQKDLDLAKELQQAVLPEVKNLPFLNIAVKYIPCSSVSGDVYDINFNREGAINIFVGDATGHGVAAAFMTMMVQIGLDSLRQDTPPNKVIEYLNSLLVSRETEKFITGVYARITPQGLLSATHAAHPPLVILPANSEEVIVLKEGGCPIGAFPESPIPYTIEDYQLKNGDKVVFYTDGVTETEITATELFGIEKTIEFLSQNRTLSIEEIIEKLLNQLETYKNGKNITDDLTILCVEYLET